MATRIEGPVITHQTEFGYLRHPMFESVDVGDLRVPSPIEVDFPGIEHQVSLFMLIEVIDGVPRCTEIKLSSHDGKTEVRAKDLKALLDWGLDNLIEQVVSICSGRIKERGVSEDGRRYSAAEYREGGGGIEGQRIVQRARRPMSTERMRKVASVYNAQEIGGLEAVARAFGVKERQAARYVKKARELGLIEGRD